MAGISHKTVGTQMTQAEWEASDSHDLSVFKPIPQVIVVAYNTVDVAKYVASAGYVYICDGTADQVQIQAAIDTGAKHIYLTPGTFNISAAIIGANNVYIEGANSESTNLLVAASTIGLDFREKTSFSLKGLKVRGPGSGTSTYGIITGYAVGTTKPELRLDDIRIEQIVGTGLDLGSSNIGGAAKDSNLTDMRIQLCTVGLDGASQGVKLIGGFISSNTECAVKARIGSQMNFYGVVFSGNAIDIKVYSDDSVSEYNFYSCWFESCTSAIVKRPDTPSVKTLSPWLFSSCLFNTHSSASALLDFTNMSMIVRIIGGRFDGGGSSKANIILGEAASLCIIDHIGSIGSLSFTGAGIGIKNGIMLDEAGEKIITTWGDTIRFTQPNYGPASFIFEKGTPGSGSQLMAIANNGAVQMNAYGAGTATFDASGNITSASDERMKEIQGGFTPGLAEILQINPISYKYNKGSRLDTENIYAGFSAQNVMKYIPEAVGKNNDGYYSLADRPIIAALVNAIKGLKAEIDELRTHGGLALKPYVVEAVKDEAGVIASNADSAIKAKQG